MSLINEALKKARLDSGRDQDRRHGVLAPSHALVRRSVWPWIVAAGSLCLAIGVIVGVVLRSDGEGRPPDAAMTSTSQSESAEPKQSSPLVPEAEQQVEAALVTPDPPTVGVPAIDMETNLESDPGPGHEPESTSTALASSAGSELHDLSPFPAPAPTAQPQVDAPPPVTPASSSPVSADKSRLPGPENGDSFLRTVPLPGGEELVLNGIAWSEIGPVALINGRALEKGEYVDSWNLVLIERHQVELTRGDVTIRVRLE